MEKKKIKITFLSELLNLNFNRNRVYLFLFNIIFIYIIINFLILFIYFEKNISNYTRIEWLINYQGGFVRRALLGEIINQYYNLIHGSYYTIIKIFSFIIYSIILYYFYIITKILYEKNIFLGLLVLLSPATIFFSIYDTESFCRKEIFIIALIFYHSHIAKLAINKKINIEQYIYKFKLIIIISLCINSLFYDLQFFFLPVHFLITYIMIKFSRGNEKILKLYLLPLILNIFIIYKSTNFSNIEYIYKSLYYTGITFKPDDAIWYLQGNIFVALGQTLKFFFYYSYSAFLEFFISFILSVGVVLFLFNFYIKNISQNYINYFNIIITVIAFVLLLLSVDFGRLFYILCMHIIPFFYIFEIKKKIIKFPINIFASLFLFCYIFFWSLPHGPIGYGFSIYNSGIIHNAKKNISHAFSLLSDEQKLKVPSFIKLELEKYNK